MNYPSLQKARTFLKNGTSHMHEWLSELFK